MKQIARDPRVDPRKGDVLDNGRTFRRVDGLVENTVNYNGNKWCWIVTWRKWAKDALVDKYAD